MKKKLLGMITFILITFVGGYNVYKANNGDRLSDLLLENIEALALPGDEIGPAPGGNNGCGYGLRYGGIGIIKACESCTLQFFVASIDRSGTC